MNNMNPWEKHLDSWTPRRPSDRVRRRLFPAAYPEYRPPIELPAWFRAAAAACVVALAFFFFAAHPGSQWQLTEAGNSNALIALSPADSAKEPGRTGLNVAVTVVDWTLTTSSVPVAVVTRLLAFSLPGERRTPQWNIWSAATFDWTRAPFSVSTTGSFWSGRTNVRNL